MRILILSESIYGEQIYRGSSYFPPYDTQIDFGEINQLGKIKYSVFDYDVSIIYVETSDHIREDYSENLEKILKDSIWSLESGRTIIIFPESENIVVGQYWNVDKYVYSWLNNLGVQLHDNEGQNYMATGLGKSKAIADYLKQTKKYYQTITNFDPEIDERLAIVQDTEITVGIERSYGRGKLIILPPPYLTDDSFQICMSNIVKLARHYY